MTFIVLEGPECAGKTTLAHQLAAASNGNVTLLREPGSTYLGEEVRTSIKSHPPTAAARQLLMHGCRLEMSDAYNLDDPNHLFILDRYTLSALVYGVVDGLKMHQIISLLREFPPKVPYLTVLLSPPWEITAGRLMERVENGEWEYFDGSMDRLEKVYWAYQRYRSVLPGEGFFCSEEHPYKTVLQHLAHRPALAKYFPKPHP